MMGDLADRLTSRKFLIALAAIVYAIVSEALGTITPAEAVDAIRTAALAYIAAEGAADVVGRIGRADPGATAASSSQGAP